MVRARSWSTCRTLLDAARTSKHGNPEVGPIIERLGRDLDQIEDAVALEDLIRHYDAVHSDGESIARALLAGPPR